MKNLAILTATAGLLVMLAQPQAAEAKAHHTYRAVVPYSGYGYGGYGGWNTYGGATIFPDGSFTNNGYSWNGADPTGGATGIYRGYAPRVYRRR